MRVRNNNRGIYHLAWVAAKVCWNTFVAVDAANECFGETEQYKQITITVKAYIPTGIYYSRLK